MYCSTKLASVQVVLIQQVVDDDVAHVSEDQLDVLRVSGVGEMNVNLLQHPSLLVNDDLENSLLNVKQKL